MNQEQIYELMKRFEDSRLAELKIESESMRIIMRKPEAMKSELPANNPAPVIQNPSVPIAQEIMRTDEGKNSTEKREFINSPVVGTFYRSPAPDAPPFVDEGSTVSEGDSICIIEAMKIMNKLEADFDCEIVKILAESGQMVEFNTPLFEVKRI